MPQPTPNESEFDYIIVGAGSAGCVLANRLSANPSNRVLLLEAGGKDNWIWFHIPVGYLFAIGNPRADWLLKTEAEPGLNGRILNYPRGKVIGGSSAINGMIYMLGQAGDYDHWRQLGLPGWSWDDVRPYFRRHVDHFLKGDHHAVGGEWRVEYPRLTWEILDAFRLAANQYGIPTVEDFNTGDNEGICYFHVNQKQGRRWSAARGFLKPVLHRQNLQLELGCLVEKLELDGKRAIGVRWRQNGEERSARCRGEVILAAGAIGSPHIMMLSGIGPGAQLAQQSGEPDRRLSHSLTSPPPTGLTEEFSLRLYNQRQGRAGLDLPYQAARQPDDESHLGNARSSRRLVSNGRARRPTGRRPSAGSSAWPWPAPPVLLVAGRRGPPGLPARPP